MSLNQLYKQQVQAVWPTVKHRMPAGRLSPVSTAGAPQPCTHHSTQPLSYTGDSTKHTSQAHASGGLGSPIGRPWSSQPKTCHGSWHSSVRSLCPYPACLALGTHNLATMTTIAYLSARLALLTVREVCRSYLQRQLRTVQPGTTPTSSPDWRLSMGLWICWFKC